MNIAGIFIPTMHLVGLVLCAIGMMHSIQTRAWNWFGLFTFLGFCLGMSMFFKFLGA